MTPMHQRVNMMQGGIYCSSCNEFHDKSLFYFFFIFFLLRYSTLIPNGFITIFKCGAAPHGKNTVERIRVILETNFTMCMVSDPL